MTHQERLSVHRVDPKATEAVLALERYVQSSGLDKGLYELVKIRASQLNGCAFCLDMHATALLEGGTSPRKLNLVAAWREAPGFSPRERAALAWTEALTRLDRHQADDALYAATCAHFSEQELVDLTYAIALINAWNRLGVALQPDLPEEA